MWTESLCRRKSSRVLNSPEKFWASCFSSEKFIQTKKKISFHSFALSSYSCIRMANMEPSLSVFGTVPPHPPPSPSPSSLIASPSPLFCWVICCATQSMSAQNTTGSESQSAAPCRGISGRYSASPPFWEMTNLIFSPSPSYLQLKCPNDNNVAALPVVRQCSGAKWPRLSQRLFKCHSKKSCERASPSDI